MPSDEHAETWVVGPVGDPLRAPLTAHLTRHGHRVRHVDDAVLFDCVFAYEHDAHGVRFTVDLGGEVVRSADVRAAVVRPWRGWTPVDVRPDDTAFVVHETTAAWVAALDALPGPVVNRYPIDWWLDDTTYLGRAAGQLAAALGLAYVPDARATTSAYLVDGTDVTGTLPRSAAAAAWAHGCGLRLVRAELAPGGLVAVDPLPAFSGEHPALVDGVAAAVAEAVA